MKTKCKDKILKHIEKKWQITFKRARDEPPADFLEDTMETRGKSSAEIPLCQPIILSVGIAFKKEDEIKVHSDK